jgi:photosystem II stability/assembly factor-like uncharacterized protein
MARKNVIIGLVLLLSSTGVAVSSEWTIADLPGGDVRSLAIHPDDPDHLLAGTATGQIFQSTDGGGSWHLPGVRLPFRGWVVSDLVFDPDEPALVWAALRGAWGQDGLIALSTDGGATWKSRSGGLPGRQVYALAVAPRTVYAATRLGVWGSRDAGESWQHLTAGHAEIRKVSSLLVDPQDPERVFAGTWRRVYRSDNGGASLRGLFIGMILDSEVFSLHAAPGGNGEIWASTCGWVYRSSNLGDSWRRYENGLAERRTPSFQVLTGGAKLAGTVAGVYRSADDGASWQLVTPKDLVVLAIEHHPARPDRIFIGTEGAGVWRSVDGGRTFQAASKGLNAARIAALASKGGEVIAAVRHSGPASGVYSSFDGGKTYPLGPVQLPTVSALAADDDSVYAATESGLFERHGDVWQRVEELDKQQIRQVITHDQQVVVRTAAGMFVRSRAGGPFAPLAFDRGKISSVAVEGDTLWISSESGGLFRLDDQGLIASATPIKKGRVHAVAGKLLMADAEELWMRPALDGAWQEVGRRVDFHSTGDVDYPLLLVGSDGVARLMGDGGRADRVLGLTVPPQHLSAALVQGRKVVLGTSGYGLLLGEIGPDSDEQPEAADSPRQPGHKESSGGTSIRSR